MSFLNISFHLIVANLLFIEFGSICFFFVKLDSFATHLHIVQEKKNHSTHTHAHTQHTQIIC